MRATPLAIPGVLLLEPVVYDDARGHFFESFNAAAFVAATGHSAPFIQDNQSRSRQGVVRGLHFQLPPFAQGKLVRVLTGAVFDVAVDIRRSSPNFGHWVGEVLSAENRRQLWGPPGFAHGFMALRDDTTVLYKVDAPYSRASEGAIRWDDPTLAVAWPATVTPLLSDKDAMAPLFEAASVFD